MNKTQVVISLDTFTRAYIECLLWSSLDQSDPDTGGSPLDENYSVEDLTIQALQSCISDCAQFQDLNRYCLEGLDPEQCGHDFWLTRNRHGAGFWDRGHDKEVAESLTNDSHAWGSVDPYVHKGKIHI